MIYWLILIALIASIGLFSISLNRYSILWNVLGGASIVVMIISGALAIVSTIQVFNETCWAESHKAELLTEREVIEYRLNNPYTENDNNLGSTELYRDITDFNSKIVKGRATHANKWTYLFAGSYYNDVEPIELN